MKFSALAHVFMLIDQQSSRTEITKLLAELFNKSTPQEAYIITYLSLGTLRPPYQETTFNLASKSVLKVAADLCNTSIEDTKNRLQALGDLGKVIAEAHWTTETDFTVLHVYEELKKLAAIRGTGAQEERISALEKLLIKLDPVSASLVMKIVLDELRLGFSDMTIIDALSWMLTGNKSLHTKIEHAYNICADIGMIAQQLKQYGIAGLNTIHITLGTPIRPAAAERLPTACAIIEKLGDCIAQPKLDGFRLQIHIKKNGNNLETHFFSRNLQDMSPMFPDLVAALGTMPVETIIMEGEAIAFHEQTNTFLPFQETVKRKRKHAVAEFAQEMPLRFFAFDILYLNGNSLLEKSHHARREILVDIFKNWKSNTVQIIEEKKIASTKDLEMYFLENIEVGLEGLVVKKPDSHYQPGKRNFNWIKLKRHEEGHLDDTLDLVVLGYYYGKGKRAKFGIGAFLVGIYDPQNDYYETIAKVGTGLTDVEWRELKRESDLIITNQQPRNVLSALQLAPDVWVTPKIVCAIRADEITRSPIHTAGKMAHELGYALRFPRIMGYRPDKSATQATTITEIKDLFKQQKKIPQQA